MTQQLDDLAASALRWADDDCDESSATQCRDMARRRELVELRDHFGGKLEFGTAGLRAKVGPGPWRMNRATVRRASRAVAEYLLLQTPGAREVTVVVGFDARASSRELARETCGTLRAAGVDVRVFDEAVPTPIVAFALRYLRADAAIVVTASHNPKEYNGFKLYGADGAQIVAPTDAAIAKLMDELGPAAEIPCVEFVLDPSNVGRIDPSVVSAYFEMLARLDDRKARCIRIAYTPLHGLGAPYVERALSEAGFAQIDVVASQRAPHPDFPTVPFPNPEEPPVMREVFALAEAQGAHVALANDPDVDRLAVGIPGPNGFVALTGNQVGVLLADYLLSRCSGVEGRPPLVVQSVVSTPMLRSIASAYGAIYERTLTGFKWIGRPAIGLPDTCFVLGFEEAIGYAVLPDVRDKDGISAALVVAELVNECHTRGSNVAEYLLTLYQRHGLWVSVQKSVNLPGASGVAQIQQAMARLRTAPCRVVGDLVVTSLTDYAAGAEARAPWLPAADLIELVLGEHGRLLVRPSGTEPKLKIYVDLCQSAPTQAVEVTGAESRLLEYGRRLASDLVGQLGLL